MTTKRITALLLIAFLLCAMAATFWNAHRQGQSFPEYRSYYRLSDYIGRVEGFLEQNLPFAGALRSLAVELQLLGGERQYNQVFIGNDILVENIGFPDEEVTQQNREALAAFLDRSRVPVNLLLLPTKCAIKQNEVHPDAPLFNQKQFIEEVYTSIQGKATAVDVYPVLFSNMDQYLYYRTDPALTSLGAYQVYSVLAPRLGFGSPKPQEEFSIQHVAHDFYGATYQALPYREITPDVISLYQYQKVNRCYTVTHNQDYPFSYNTLYPTHLLDLGRGLEVFLGGDSGDVTVQSNAQSGNSLLILGDESILPVIPFLMAHYSQIRYVDLGKWQQDQLSQLRAGDYQRVLVAYSVDTFIHSQAPSRLAQVSPVGTR